MSTIRIFSLSLLLWLAGAVVTCAQTEQRINLPAPPTDATVTVSLTAKGVRFAAPGRLGQMRLEVFNANGDSLYNSEFQPGTVRDWAVRDKQGLALPDGAYLCVVTLRDLAGRLSVKQGNVLVQNGQAALQLSESTQVGAVEPEKALAPVSDSNATSAALLVHNGRDAQLVSTHGGLTFRVGDFFGGQDRELMRLTPEGNLGLGTTKPQARLDVAGDIRATGLLHVSGIAFPNGTVQTAGQGGRVDAQGNIMPAASGAGTQGRYAKWTDNSGTLGDSLLSDVGNNVVNNGTNIQMTAPATSSADTNLIFVDNNSRTTGVIASSTPAFSSTNGPYFAMRGNTYSALANQRGLFAISAGNINAPVSNEGGIVFLTGNDQLRMFIKPTGEIGVGTNTPQAKLDVAGGDLRVGGNVNATGNINATGTITGGNVIAQYQDIA
ncbi:MAG TPA: hypothetical protein VE821_09050, partial [Pyrinomonadaceae bacterium]|nr:hypothetical protein [Pyrinomonadaceae bacterium]